MNWNPFEMAASAVLNHPYAKAARDTIRFAGDKLRPILPEGTGVAIDTGENAIRAVTGDRSPRGPASYTGETRDALANAVDNAQARGSSSVQYEDYRPGSMDHLVTGRMSVKPTKDGTYTISPNEIYDYNAGSMSGDSDYMDNARGAFNAAVERRDLPGILATGADLLSGATGMGAEGFNIGGSFRRSDDPAPMPGPGQSPMTPQQQAPPKASVTFKGDTGAKPKAKPEARGYTVRAGDTLTDIARAQGVSIADLVAKNKIANADLINVGQQLSW